MERTGLFGLVYELLETYLLTKVRSEDDPQRFAAVVETGALTRATAYMLGYTYSSGYDDNAKTWRAACQAIREYVVLWSAGLNNDNTTRAQRMECARQIVADLQDNINHAPVTTPGAR